MVMFFPKNLISISIIRYQSVSSELCYCTFDLLSVGCKNICLNELLDLRWGYVEEMVWSFSLQPLKTVFFQCCSFDSNGPNVLTCFQYHKWNKAKLNVQRKSISPSHVHPAFILEELPINFRHVSDMCLSLFLSLLLCPWLFWENKHKQCFTEHRHEG